MKNASSLSSLIVSLHDQLKALVLISSQDFPAQATGGLEFLETIAELQTSIAAYLRELLIRLFQSTQQGTVNVIFSSENASRFLNLWLKRAKLPSAESGSENEIDTSIRELVALLHQETHLMSENELRAAVEKDADIPEMLYYLSTLQESLGWYVERYVGRLAGHFGERVNIR